MYDRLIADNSVLPSPADPESAARALSDFIEQIHCATDEASDFADFISAMSEDRPLRDLFLGVFGNSPFLAHSCIREIEFVRELCSEGPDQRATQVIDDTRALITLAEDEVVLMRKLRIHKRRIAIATALADIAGLWPLERVTETLSAFADAAASAAAAFVIRRAGARGAFTVKHPDDPEYESGFVILGMGKLGARELNYSSDIDLICLFDPDRIQTDDPDGLQQHFIRMTRTLAKILDERTMDGYVFRVDLRLRPDPGSTPLAISLLAAETYYESLGQNWERAAMIKARPIAGDKDAGDEFLSNLRPFVWRKNLDFAAIQDIHSIKRQIHAHKGGGEIAVNGHDIKTGRGGIREIEFFAQTQQLIWGGRVPAVRSRRTLGAIRALVEMGQVDLRVSNSLDISYHFLRTLEHRLQMQRDEQTQTLPSSDEGIAAVAAFMGYVDAKAFRKDLLKHLNIVQQHYGALFENAPSLTADNGIEGNLSFTGVDPDPETLATLTRYGFEEPAKVDTAIRAWHHGRIRATRSTRAREILTELTPALLSELSKQPDPDATFIRFDTFLSGLPSGVQLFSMFQAFPNLLGLLAEIMGEAPRLATHLGRRPKLLDNVLSVDFYGPLPGVEELIDDCRRALTDTRFFEDVLDATRRWNGDKRFQIGVQMLRHVISPADAARHFSDVADAVLQTLFPYVIKEFEERHGCVPDSSFCVIALGKLGSKELTPSSDLDLVFVYDCPDITTASDGDRPLAASQYFSRLGQRLITSVMAMTAEGSLYEIDMRLRPSGNKGPLSASLDSFVKYHAEDAWTWEHMALVRSRIVFDWHGMSERMNKEVRKILERPRTLADTRKEVAEMRGRIEKQHGTKCIWNIKQAAGGQVDVDFIAQFIVIAYAHDAPDIIAQNAEAIFNGARQSGLLKNQDVETLCGAKKFFRGMTTFLSLAIEGDLTDEKVTNFSPALKEDLAWVACTPTFDGAVRKLAEMQKQVRNIFETLIGPIDT